MKPNNFSEVAKVAISEGNMQLFNKLTGGFYWIKGIVVHGNHLGRKLGFPTANLKMFDNNLFLPPYGVYAVYAVVERRAFKGMANAGIRPTVDGKTMNVEINLFDFSEDLYGKILVVQFIDRIRDEKKFKNLDELVIQIREDKRQALCLLA
ncbi:MAG: hypothetical protein NT004_04680 [Bacteroidetes bacterium]|nr:hypothetical protein [Bacteroidota bacterium]